MLAAIPFPDLSPELFTIRFGNFEFALRWYALAYIAGLLFGWRLVVALMKRPALWPGQVAPMQPAQVEQLLTWVILGVILGGRLGFVLFYQPGYYISYPSQILRIWEGGMAFHGGFLGVVVATILFCRRNGIPMLQTADAMAVATPIGLMLGRLANFVNAELWGRPTTQPWGVIFPGEAAQSCPWDWVGPCARHPSQLYQAMGEGLFLFLLLAFLVWRLGWLRQPGRVLGAFLAGYGLARFVVEFFRQPDAQFVAPGNPLGHALQLGEAGLTMGQLLSLPMIAFGIALILLARRPASAAA
ncbi:prolipoprotein diacylglyceryl transferase [Plastorhodobacter daqingensis]|uniref:Phosphatidylglycerol--prolipoprotein diacylglyceryl transferase n=1 Tax=Plastorhodobacter daqingensis TaxID=1387281 RepID=A0ABW2UGQ1_9RHOB